MKRSQLDILAMLEQSTTLKEVAKTLQKNPSTIGRSLKKLEEELDCSLFHASGKTLTPTPEGKMITEYAHAFANLMRELEHSLFPQSDEPPYHNWSEREVQYLLMIRQKENLSHAAEELFVSQPSLSQLLHTLDSFCNCSVFETSRGGLRLTQEGKILFVYIEKMDSIFQSIHQELEEFRNLRRDTLKIGIPTSLGSSLMPLIVPDFLRRFPGIRLRILENNSQQLKHMLKEKQLDACILHENTNNTERANAETIDEYIHYQMYYEEPLFLVIPRKWKEDLALPEDRPIEALDLLKLEKVPFVLVSKRRPLRNVIQRIFENVHALTSVPFNPAACCSSKNIETIKSLVLAEVGITFLPASYLHFHSDLPELISYPLAKNLKGTWTLALALPQETSMSRSTREFIDIMKASVKKIYGSGFINPV